MAGSNGIFGSDSGQPVSVFDKLAIEALNGILHQLKKDSTDGGTTSRETNELLGDIVSGQESDRNQRSKVSKASASNDRAVQKALSLINSSQKKSMASAANNRAVDKALYGKHNKDNINALKDLKDVMKNCFDSLKGALLGVLNDTLKTQTQYAKLMRQNFLTKGEKDRSQMMANSAQANVQNLLGFKLDKSEIVEYFNALQAGGHDLEAMGTEATARYAALRKSGLEDAEAYKLAMEGSTETIKTLTTAATDPRTRALIKAQIADISEAEKAKVGLDTLVMQAVQGAQSAASAYGGAITDFEKVGKDLRNNAAAANGMWENVDGARLAMQGGIKDVVTYGQDMISQFAGFSDEQLRALASSGDEATSSMANQALQIRNMQANSANIAANVRSESQNKQALSDNASNGKVNFEIQKMFGQIDNNIFGGAIGKLSNTMDEMLGDSADVGRLVSSGFKIVSALLKSIWLNTNGVMKWVIGGLGAVGAVVAIVANWDKIKPKLGELFDTIKPVLDNLVQNIPGFIKDVVSGIGSLLPQVWKGAKDTFSGLFGSSNAIGKAGSFISGGLSSLSAKLSGPSDKSSMQEVKSGLPKIDMSDSGESGSSFKGLLDGVGSAIADAILGNSDIILKVVEVIGKFIDAVAPSIPPLVGVLQTIADAIVPVVDAIREIGVSLIDGIREIVITTVESIKDVLLALTEPIRLIAEAIDVLSKAIAPVIPTIVDTLEFGVKKILPPVLKLLDKVVDTILPPIVDIAKKIVNTILPQLANLFEKLVDVIMPPVASVLQTIADIVDRISNLVIDVIEPPLKAISEAVASVVSVVTSAANVINSILEFVEDIINTAHGLFDFFKENLPNIIGTLSGTFSWISDYIFPIVKDGFNVLYNIVNTFYNGLKLIITVALSPIKKVIDAIDFGIKSIKQVLLRKFDVGAEEHTTAVARRDAEEAALLLQGHSTSETTKALKQAYEDYIANNNIGDSDSETGKKAEELWKRYTDALSKEKSEIEKALDNTANAGRELQNAVSEFKGSIEKAINSGGPKFDAAMADKAAQSILGQSIRKVALPENTGSLLETITDNVKKTTEILTSIHNFVSKIKAYAGGSSSTNGPGLVGEAGREAIFPLDNPSALKRVIDNMSSSDKKQLANATVGDYGTALSKLNAWKGGRLKPKDFVEMIGPIARQAMISTGLPASVLIAQAALETGWGKTAKAEFRNLFGMKGRGDAGSASVWTHEIRKDGSKEVKKDVFAQYSSYLASIEAYNRYLMNAKRPNHNLPGDLRYAEALMHVFEPDLFAYLIRDGGYATSANYGQKLVGTMKSNRLYRFDVPPSLVVLKNVGKIQTDLIAKARENLSRPASSAQRMLQLQKDEYERLVKRAKAENRAIPPVPSALKNADLNKMGATVQDTISSKELSSDEYSKLYSDLADGTDIVAESVKSKTDTQLETLQNLSKSAINTVIAQTNGQVKYDVSNSKSAKKISDSSSQRDEIVLAMKDVVRYLRDMASFIKKPAGASVPTRLPHA